MVKQYINTSIMKNKILNTRPTKIEHRGYDSSASKNFDMEMRMVKSFNKLEKDATRSTIGDKQAK